MSRKDLFFRIFRRTLPVLALAAIGAFVILVGVGKLALPLLDSPIRGDEKEVVGGGTRDEEDIKNEDILGSLGVGDNISGIGGGTASDITAGDDADETQGEANAPTVVPEKAEGEEYIPYERLAALKYHVTDADYLPNSAYVFIGELTLPAEVTRDHVEGQKTVISDEPKAYEDGGEYFYNPVEKSDYRYKVETYMGYIIVSDGAVLCIYRGDGTHLTTLGISECEPAMRRSDSGEPLFIDGSEDGSLYYLDDSGRKCYLDGSETDRGLYFDYRASLGAPEGGLSVLERDCLVSFHDEIDTSDYYILSSMSPELAESIYSADPSYAEKVARYNPRFKEALETVKNAPKPEETTASDEVTTAADPNETSADPVETTSDDLTTSTDDTTANADEVTISDGEVTASPEPDETAPDTESGADSVADGGADTSSEDPEEETDVPETEIDTDTDTEPQESEDTEVPSQDTESESEPSEPETSSFTVKKDGKLLIIDRSELRPRYAYAFDDTDRDLLVWKYAHAYAYSEGRAAVVDDDGVLRYIDGEGNVVIDGTGTKMVTNSRYITTEYALPNIRNSEMAKGYIYFDDGLVRVRKLERDYTFRNLIYSDSDVLLRADGTEYEIPEGYTLAAYSEGVLVLKSGNGKYGYYHKDGYWIAQPIYTSIKPFSEGLGVLGFTGGKKGVIDKAGNVIVPFAYEYISSMSSGVMTLYDRDCESGWRILVKAGV